jgi:hypothetical protein
VDELRTQGQVVRSILPRREYPPRKCVHLGRKFGRRLPWRTVWGTSDTVLAEWIVLGPVLHLAENRPEFRPMLGTHPRNEPERRLHGLVRYRVTRLGAATEFAHGGWGWEELAVLGSGNRLEPSRSGSDPIVT